MNKIIDIKLLKFLSVGIINTFVGVVIMFCLYNLAGCSYWVSSAVNYVLVSMLSYFLNKKFTFRYRGTVAKSGAKFALNIAVCYFISYGVAKPLIKMVMSGAPVYLQENVAMIVGMCIFTGLNYIGQRFFVFGDIPMRDKIQYKKWLNSPHIEEVEKNLLRKMSDGEVHEAFYKYVEFGTSGMRGIMGPGTNRLNKYTIRMAAKGMSELLGSGTKVAVAYDTRKNSDIFARETARVMAAVGIKVYLFDRYSPVPLLSFAIRELGCDGGVAITASHNTWEYNGFKAYDSTGCQISPETAMRIADNIKHLEDDLNIKLSNMDDKNIEYIGDEIIRKFISAASSCKVDLPQGTEENLKVIYSSLYGSGRDYIMEALRKAGFTNVSLVEEQSAFNGSFPGLKRPNPEDSAVFDVAEHMALASGGDIIIATDPDCDRIGVSVVMSDYSVCLTGNQIGILMMDFLAQHSESRNKTFVTTIVSSGLASDIADSYGIEVKETLTGFKYIGGEMNKLKADEFFMAYEESFGYLVGTHTRDKDAVSAAVVICQMAAFYKSRGMTLLDALNHIYDKYGHYIDVQESFVFEGSQGEKIIQDIMIGLRQDGEFAFSEVAEMKDFKDYNKGIDGLPAANVFKYIFMDGSWVAVRPSGTEPKIKFYYCIKGADIISADKMYEKLKKSVAIITGN